MKTSTARLAQTDAFIDQVVYRLVGLTAEEIAIVEDAVEGTAAG